MAPCKPAKVVKVCVPRQNAQRLGPSLTSQVRAVGRQDGVLVQLPPPVQEQPSSAGVSSENSSEWNSLLLSARAQRGPFWDVGTQQFLVEKESELYYDPTPLLEAARSLTKGAQNSSSASGSNASQQQQQQLQLQQQQQQQQQQQLLLLQQQQRNAYASQQSQQYGYANNASTPVMRHATPARNMAYSGTPGGRPQGQFYGDSVTPTRPGMMDGAEMYGRRITRGMGDGYQVYGS